MEEDSSIPRGKPALTCVDESLPRLPSDLACTEGY